jgi:hypothetical protein
MTTVQSWNASRRPKPFDFADRQLLAATVVFAA